MVPDVFAFSFSLILFMSPKFSSFSVCKAFIRSLIVILSLFKGGKEVHILINTWAGPISCQVS